jgi:hypothetical protein
MLEYISATQPEEPRSDYLRRVFGERIDFIHHGNSFAYVYIGELEGVVVGRLGRKAVEKVVEPPERGYTALERDGYRAVNIFIDTSGDPTGQRLAVKLDPKVGNARKIVERLIDQINTKDADAPWLIEFRPIIDEASFWSVVAARQADITSVQFDFVVPNVLGLGSKISDELKVAMDENNAGEVGVELKNKYGIKVDTPSIRETMPYVSKGGGDVILKSGQKTIFNSKNKVTTVDVEEDQDISPDNQRVWRRLIERIFGK